MNSKSENPIESPDYRELTKAGLQATINAAPDSCIYEPIHALCWKQPMASLMLPATDGSGYGGKVETRSRPMRQVPRLVLIVATQAPFTDRQLVDLCGGALALMIQARLQGRPDYVNGAAIGIGTLYRCGELTKSDRTFIRPDLHRTRVGWWFRDVFAIEPIAVPGFQGWRHVGPDLRSQIKLI